MKIIDIQANGVILVPLTLIAPERRDAARHRDTGPGETGYPACIFNKPRRFGIFVHNQQNLNRIVPFSCLSQPNFVLGTLFTRLHKGPIARYATIVPFWVIG